MPDAQALHAGYIIFFTGIGSEYQSAPPFYVFLNKS